MTIDFRDNLIYQYNGSKKELKPFSTKFSEIEVLLDGRILVIEEYYNYSNKGKSNLYCVNRTLDVEWFLPYPFKGASSIDNYVGFASTDSKVFAFTFSGWRVEIEAKSGLILNTQLTK